MSNTGIKEKEVQVLYQKLGGQWYVFSEINEEVFFSPLPEGLDPHSSQFELFEVIEDHLESMAKSRKKGPEIAI